MKIKKSATDPGGTPTPEVKIETEKVTKKYKYFDLSDFSEKSQDVSIDFAPAKTFEDAVARLGSDQKILVNALNAALKKAALREASATVKSQGVSKKAMLDFIKPYRNASPFKELVTTEKGDKNWKDQYNAQTKALIEQVKNVPFMVEAIKSASANMDDEDEGADSEE